MKTLLLLAIAIFLPFSANGAEETKALAPFIEWVNEADDGFILDVKGIGPVKLAAIVAGRPYAEEADLLDVKGVGEVTLQAMRDYFDNLK